MMSSDEARALARRAVELTAADEAEALVVESSSALTRFANNHIHQNVAEEDASVSVRAVIGKRIGVASTNRTDEGSLRAVADAAVRAASQAAEDPAFPGLTGPEPVDERTDRACEATRAFDAEARARAVGSIIEQSASRGLTAAGTLTASSSVTAVANSKGVAAAMPTTGAKATVLSMGPDSGSGWASWTGIDASELAPAALGDEAATLAERSAHPGDLEPGEYTVVLAPDAVADVLDFLAYVGFSAKAYEEGRSFMSGKLEQCMFGSELVTITDDALAPEAMGLTFDYEGAPKHAVSLIEYGVPIRPVTDSYWASKGGWPNSGHALPAPSEFGPYPLNMSMSPGEATIDELVGSIERGVYVTRFHYVNVEDPMTVLLTGMTRDGTFMIENGHLARPLKNLRFTQSALEVLKWTSGVTRQRRFVGSDEYASLVPGIRVDRFNFTGQTS
jgi:PmbA protein